MIQQQGIIRFRNQVAPDCFHLGLDCEGELSKAVPGQFVMVQVGSHETPLLRRPFSICGLMSGRGGQAEGIELLVKAVGPGTRWLTGLPPGQSVDLLGPLGHGFRVSADDKRIYLAAGGIGVAPIRFLASDLIDKGVHPESCRIFLGGRSRQDLLCREDFQALGIAVTATTDDGSDGDQCLVTDPLEIAIQDRRPDVVCACGPHGMLACVAGIVERHQVRCQLSIETMMACGMGVCLGCAVESRKQQDTYMHACIHGPVFNAEDLNFAY
jgi:dihydroorotate dehydrogenase electron transfer subunit